MSKKSTVAMAILAGVAIGAVAGVLLAPDKGSQTRRRIKDGIDEAKDDLKNKFDAASANLKQKAAELDVDGSFNEVVSSFKQKANDVISYFESKVDAMKQDADMNRQ